MSNSHNLLSIAKIFIYVILISFGTILPNAGKTADLNGYTAEYDIDLNIPTPTGSVTCSGGSAINPNASNEYIIRDNGGWSNINSGSFSKFFVCPGNYLGLGQIVLTVGGSSGTPRWVVLWYPGIDPNGHPARANSSPLDNITPIPLANQARVAGFKFENAPWWKMDRITVVPNNTIGIEMKYNGRTIDSDNVVINRILVEGDDMGPPMSTNYGIRIQDADNTTVQNSVVRNCAIRVNSDSLGMWVWAGERDVHLVNNEIYNCGQAYQHGDQNVDGEGFVAENNDLYVTPALYMGCGQANGIQEGQTFEDVADPNGHCMCAESIVDHKFGSDNVNNPVLIIHNRMWGAREEGWAWNEENPKGAPLAVTRECGGSGSYPGRIFGVIDYTKYLVFDRNILSDAEIALRSGHAPLDGSGSGDYRNNTFRNNLVYDIHDFADADGDQTDAAFYFGQGTKFDYSYNTIVDSDTWVHGDLDFSLICNVVVDGGTVESAMASINAAKNIYVGNTNYVDSGSDEEYTKSQAHLAQFSYYRKLITAPEKETVDNVIPTGFSPFIGHCSSSDEKSGYGLDG